METIKIYLVMPEIRFSIKANPRFQLEPYEKIDKYHEKIGEGEALYSYTVPPEDMHKYTSDGFAPWVNLYDIIENEYPWLNAKLIDYEYVEDDIEECTDIHLIAEMRVNTWMHLFRSADGYADRAWNQPGWTPDKRYAWASKEWANA